MKICDKCSNACESQLNGEFYCVNCTKNEMGSFEVDIRNTHNPDEYCLLSMSKNCINPDCNAVFTKDDYESKANVTDDDEFVDHCIICTKEARKTRVPQRQCGQCGATFQRPDIDLNSAQGMCC